MKVALAGDFVTSAGDLGDHLGLMLAYPTQNEERGLHAELVEKIEREFAIALHPALEPVPVVGCDEPAHRTNMAIILENNAQDVSCGPILRERVFLFDIRRSHRLSSITRNEEAFGCSST